MFSHSHVYLVRGFSLFYFCLFLVIFPVLLSPGFVSFCTKAQFSCSICSELQCPAVLGYLGLGFFYAVDQHILIFPNNKRKI